MSKKFRSKKRIKLKFLPFVAIILILFLLNYIEKNISIELPYTKIVDIVFGSSNNYNYKGKEKNNISDELYAYINDYIFNSPLNILDNEYSYKEDVKVDTVNFKYVENKDFNKPTIYIYNSHQGETYSREYLEDYNIVPDVLMASNMLKDKLENIGIKAVVENSNILNYMQENNLNHAGSYLASRHFLLNAMEKYPNAALYIDLHRDSLNHSFTITNINGKTCAKILFVIGLEYSTYENNLKVITDINNIILSKYPSLTRGILKKEGYGVNGVYNQDLSGNIILIEVGGYENNIEEINNTLDLLSEIIGEYINEKK